MNKQPIGFIDSGVGGLTVVKEALHQLPAESSVYWAIRLVCHMARDLPNKYRRLLGRWSISCLKSILKCSSLPAILPPQRHYP